MNMIKNIIEYLIAIVVIPAIVLTVINVTELKDVKNVQFELLSEEENKFIITTGTFNKLMENKGIRHYDIESNYPLITREEMDRATWQVGDIKNEIYIDENGEKRIRLNVGQITFDGSEDWRIETYEGKTYFYVTNDYFPNRVESFNSTNLKVIINNNLLPYSPNKFTTLSMYWTTTVVAGYFEIYMENMTQAQFKEYLSQNPLTVTYELADKQTRPVEVYDFSTFKLVYHKNSIKVLFDIDNGYYLWEITNDDKMIPINGQYDIGGVWTVKYYVYEIQQPIIRTLVLLIPLIVIGGLLIYQYDLLKKKGLSN